jgi:hypothetical protein
MSYCYFDFLDVFLIFYIGLTCILAIALLTNNPNPFTLTFLVAVTLTTLTTWNIDNLTTGMKRGGSLTLYPNFLPFYSVANYVFCLNRYSPLNKIGVAPWFFTA